VDAFTFLTPDTLIPMSESEEEYPTQKHRGSLFWAVTVAAIMALLALCALLILVAALGH
jgi:hypothetical protein